MIKESLKVKGVWNYVMTSPDGEIEAYGTIKNLVVTTGRQHIADQLADLGEAAMSHMAIGTGATAPVLGNSTLETEISRKTFAAKAQLTGGDGNKVKYQGDWAAGEGTGAITEVGMFNAASGGVMFNRATFDVINKGAASSLSIVCTVTYAG